MNAQRQSESGSAVLVVLVLLVAVSGIQMATGRSGSNLGKQLKELERAHNRQFHKLDLGLCGENPNEARPPAQEP